MKYIKGCFAIGTNAKEVDLSLSAVLAGPSPGASDDDDDKPRTANGGQKSIAMFATPSPKKKKKIFTAPMAPTVLAPPTQLSPTSDTSTEDENDDDLFNKKPAATQEAEVLDIDDDDDDDDDIPLSTLLGKNKTSPAASPSPAPAPAPVEVIINDIKWTETEPTPTLLNNGHANHDWHHKTSIIGVHICDDSDVAGTLPLLHYFNAAFPLPYLDKITDLTNVELEIADLRPVTSEEILKFFGILLLIPRLPSVPRKSMWTSTPITKYSVAPNLGSTGMTRDRFEEIYANIRFSRQPVYKPHTMSTEEYQWMLVNDFVSALNEWKATKFNPGTVICIDESIIRWYGLGGEYIAKGAPHYVSIDTKPDKGIEVQTSACAKSGVMCQYKIVCSTAKTKRRNHIAYVPKDENAGTTAVKQLTEPWYGTNRVAVGDSAFSSVATALEMKRLGLGYIGVVKNATKSFPMKALSSQVLSGKGDFTGMKARVDNIDLLAFTWCDRSRRSFIATAGSLAKGHPQERVRWCPVDGSNEMAQKMFIQIDIPLAAKMYYSAAGAIDYHNRVRSKEARIEKCLKTHNWAIRTNLGLLSMVFGDAWMLYKAARGDGLDFTPSEFFEKLSEELIDAENDATTTRSTKKKEKGLIHQQTNVYQRPSKRMRAGTEKQRKQYTLSLHDALPINRKSVV